MHQTYWRWLLIVKDPLRCRTECEWRIARRRRPLARCRRVIAGVRGQVRACERGTPSPTHVPAVTSRSGSMGTARRAALHSRVDRQGKPWHCVNGGLYVRERQRGNGASEAREGDCWGMAGGSWEWRILN